MRYSFMIRLTSHLSLGYVRGALFTRGLLLILLDRDPSKCPLSARMSNRQRLVFWELHAADLRLVGYLFCHVH